MRTLSRFQRNAIMRAAAAAAVAIPITVTPSLFSARSQLFSNTGVAPFAAVFHGCNTTDTETTNPFRDCAYVWNFGETTGPGVGTWGSNAADSTASRNWGYGPVAGHVYETPGTYTVTLQVTSAVTGNISSVTTTITVLDPAVVYAGTKTVCVSSSGNFTAAPAGCVQLTASNPNAIQPYLGNGMRFLFRRGETFTATATTDVPNLGTYSGCTVADYGSGAKPVIYFNNGDNQSATINTPAIGFGNDCRWVNLSVYCRNNLITASIDNGAGASGNILTVTAVSGTGPAAPLAVGDCIAGPGLPTGVKITSLGTGTGGVGTYNLSASYLVASTTMVTGNSGARGFQNSGTSVAYNTETKGWGLLLRCDFQRCWSSIIVDGIGNAVQDCTTSNHSGQPAVFPGIGNTGGCSIFCIANGTQYQYIAGNNFDRSFTGEHTGRFQGTSYSLYEANYWKGANSTKVLLATRGMVGASAGMVSTSYVVRNNKFDLLGGTNISDHFQIGVQNTTTNEPTDSVLVEHNFFGHYDYSQNYYAPNCCDIQHGSNVTIRNNAADFSNQPSPSNNSGQVFALLTGQTQYGTAPSFTQSPTPGASNVLVKNNSIYCSTTSRVQIVADANVYDGTNYAGVAAYPTGTVIENNMMYAPSTGGNMNGASNHYVYYTGNTNVSTKGVENNNSTDTQVKTVDPLFSNPTTYAGFTLGAGSYGLSAGMGINYSPSAV